MENKKLPTILVLTSVDPHNGPAVVAENFYRAFLNQGFSVDFMCPYPVDGHPEYLHIYNGKRSKLNLFFHPVTLINRVYDFILKQLNIKRQKIGYNFFIKRKLFLLSL